jgi:hypothetical protein
MLSAMFLATQIRVQVAVRFKSCASRSPVRSMSTIVSTCVSLPATARRMTTSPPRSRVLTVLATSPAPIAVSIREGLIFCCSMLDTKLSTVGCRRGFQHPVCNSSAMYEDERTTTEAFIFAQGFFRNQKVVAVCFSADRAKDHRIAIENWQS